MNCLQYDPSPKVLYPGENGSGIPGGSVLLQQAIFCKGWLIGWFRKICISCSFKCSMIVLPVCPMYTLPHSHGIVSIPGVRKPKESSIIGNSQYCNLLNGLKTGCCEPDLSGGVWLDLGSGNNHHLIKNIMVLPPKPLFYQDWDSADLPSPSPSPTPSSIQALSLLSLDQMVIGGIAAYCQPIGDIETLISWWPLPVGIM